MFSFCAECSKYDCPDVDTFRLANGVSTSWSAAVEDSHRVLRGRWAEPHKSLYEPTTVPPTSALLSMQSELTSTLAMIEAFGRPNWPREKYVEQKAYAYLGLAYICLLLEEFGNAEDHYKVFMNLLLAYFNAVHEDPDHSLLVFQRTLRSGHISFCVTKYDLSAHRPCLTTLNEYADIKENPSLASSVKSLVPYVMKNSANTRPFNVMTPEEMVRAATELKKAGNLLCKAKDWKRAREMYEEALEKISGLKTDAELVGVLWSNISIVSLKQGFPVKSADAARNAISVDNANTKAYLRLSKALFASADYRGALTATIDAQKNGDEDWRKEINAEQERIPAAIETKVGKRACHKKA